MGIKTCWSQSKGAGKMVALDCKGHAARGPTFMAGMKNDRNSHKYCLAPVIMLKNGGWWAPVFIGMKETSFVSISIRNMAVC